MPLTRVVVEAIVAIEATSSREGVHLSAIHAYLGPGYTLNSITIALKKCQTDGLVVQRHGLFSLVRRLGMTPAEASPTFKEPKALATRGINLFIFHRDYRLVDNTALLKAPRPFVPAFIFTPQQSDIHVSAYCSSAALQFMCESLLELNQELNSLGTRLHVFRGDNLDILNQVISPSFHDNVSLLYVTLRNMQTAAQARGHLVNHTQSRLQQVCSGARRSDSGLVSVAKSSHPALRGGGLRLGQKHPTPST
eukprot:m.71344 g.71344  ORF g.71344 m.71344 type:complete len:251 (+) comp50181_c0_seq1:126-878(+)